MSQVKAPMLAKTYHGIYVQEPNSSFSWLWVESSCTVGMMPQGCFTTSPMRANHVEGQTPVLGTDPPGHQGHRNTKQLNHRGSQGGSGISCNCFFVCVKPEAWRCQDVTQPWGNGSILFCRLFIFFFFYCYFFCFVLWRKTRHPWQELALQNHLNQTHQTTLYRTLPFAKCWMPHQPWMKGTDLPSKSLTKSPAG